MRRARARCAEWRFDLKVNVSEPMDHCDDQDNIRCAEWRFDLKVNVSEPMDHCDDQDNIR